MEFIKKFFSDITERNITILHPGLRKGSSGGDRDRNSAFLRLLDSSLSLL